MKETERRRTLRLTYLEGSFWAIMVGTAENFGLYYVVKRGLSAHEVALISTVPILFGAIFNWLVPQIVSARHLKAGVLVCVGIQVLGLGLLAKSVGTSHYFAWAFVALSLYYIGGMGASPIWIDWVAGWLPMERFGRFYSRRSALLAFFNFMTFMIAAYLIHSSQRMSTFFYVFGVGFFARAISGVILSFQASPPNIHEEKESNSMRPTRWPWKTLIFVLSVVCVFKFVSSISSPFFLPYMMKQLQMNVFEISVVNGMSFLGLAILLPSFGEAIRSYQPFVGLQVAMFMAAANCLAWTFVSGMTSIAALQFFAGLYWAVLDLSCVLILQSNFPGRSRKILGLFMAMTTLATVGGGVLGSWLLDQGTGYLNVFRLSAYLRFVIGGVLFFAFIFSKTLRTPLRTYGAFMKMAIQINLSSVGIRRVMPLLKRGK